MDGKKQGERTLSYFEGLKKFFPYFLVGMVLSSITIFGIFFIFSIFWEVDSLYMLKTIAPFILLALGGSTVVYMIAYHYVASKAPLQIYFNSNHMYYEDYKHNKHKISYDRIKHIKTNLSKPSDYFFVINIVKKNTEEIGPFYLGGNEGKNFGEQLLASFVKWLDENGKKYEVQYREPKGVFSYFKSKKTDVKRKTG